MLVPLSLLSLLLLLLPSPSSGQGGGDVPPPSVDNVMGEDNHDNNGTLALALEIGATTDGAPGNSTAADANSTTPAPPSPLMAPLEKLGSMLHSILPASLTTSPHVNQSAPATPSNDGPGANPTSPGIHVADGTLSTPSPPKESLLGAASADGTETPFPGAVTDPRLSAAATDDGGIDAITSGPTNSTTTTTRAPKPVPPPTPGPPSAAQPSVALSLWTAGAALLTLAMGTALIL